MAKLEPKEISLSEINNGNEYENGDIVDASSINYALEASAYAQEKANQALERAISAGTSVKVNGTVQTVLNFDSDPQSQIDVLKKLYGVGSIYMSTNSTSPASLFGGTWERIKDRFLLGSGDSYGAGTTGGSASVKLTGTNMSDYMLDLGQNNSGETKYIPGCYWDSSHPYANGDYVVSLGYMLNSHGGNNYVYNQPHENMPPYLAVYIWKRTA